MGLHDVSHDSSMIGWLRNAGHGHMLDEQRQLNISSPALSGGGYYGAGGGYDDSFNRSASISRLGNPNNQVFNRFSSPQHFASSPTQFLAPHHNTYGDPDVEHLRRDPNTRIVHRPAEGDVHYKQRVFVKYLQPPTPPVGGTIIVRERRPPPPPPEAPLVIRRAAPPAPTPPPVVIREHPPPLPPPEGTTIINKMVPSGPRPPRQVIVEQFPALPPKPQDVIIERWLPSQPRQRRILYERLPPEVHAPTQNIIIQHGQPTVRIQREVHTAPGSQIPHPQALTQMNLNQGLSQFGVGHQTFSTLPSSSLLSYNPFSMMQPTYNSTEHPLSNVIITQAAHPNIMSSSSYGMPLTCTCTPNAIDGLGAYGSGISMIPTVGHSMGQSTVYNVPAHVPVENVLRQLGIEPHGLQHASGIPNFGTNPQSAVSNVWNAAMHGGVHTPASSVGNAWDHILQSLHGPHGGPQSAVSNVWNAAMHAGSHTPASSVGNVWDHIEHSLHGGPQSSVWNPATHPGGQFGSSPVSNAWDHIEHSLHGQSGGGYQSSPQQSSSGGAASNVLSRLFGGH